MGPFGLFRKKKASRMLTCECGHTIKGSSDDDVLKRAGEHSKTVHNKEMTADMREKMRAMIKAA